MIPQLLRYEDIGVFLLRITAGVIFISSGWGHVRNPAERGKQIGMSKGFTLFLGTAEIAGSLGIMFGVLTQIAALGLIVLMLGAIQKKIAVWHTGFWGKNGYGWHYDLMLVVMCLMIVFTDGGRYVLLR
jgi:putative oxidoreductase